MTIWELTEYAAWVLSALIAAYLLGDAVRISRHYDEEFLVHTLEDLGELTTDAEGHVKIEHRQDSPFPDRREEGTS